LRHKEGEIVMQKVIGRRGSRITGVVVLLFLLVLGNVVLAAEFSADMVQTHRSMTTNGKVYIQANKMRMEMNTPKGTAINIMDTDAGLMRMVQPEQKMYIEMKAPQAGIAQSDEALAKMADKKKVGTEKINGYDCDKFEIIYHDKNLGKTTQWFSNKLNFPIKMVYEGPQGQMITEYKNIKEGKQDSSLFQVPAGYRKMEMPGGMGHGS
jgi:hypothetical protein